MKTEVRSAEIESNSMFTFITTNSEKINTAHRHLDPLGINFSTEEIVIPELQSDSIEEVVTNKAREAYNLLKKPLVVTDHGWNIPTLNGFPGPFMKFMNKWLSAEDFLDLMGRHEDKTVIKTEVLCYIDESKEKIFKCSMTGNFLSEKRGEGLPGMQVISLLPSGKSVAECITEGIDMSDKYRLWEDFIEWYRENKL
jgi:XTP/dITP diphosphohydrolase